MVGINSRTTKRNSVPRYNTPSVHSHEAEAFEEAFQEWTQNQLKDTSRDFVAIDGKTLRRSHDRAHKKSAVHIVSAFSSGTSLVLGQIQTSEKSNEITAIPQLIDALELKQSIISIDAMGCQRSISNKMRENKADYVFAVKDNQQKLHDQLKAMKPLD